MGFLDDAVSFLGGAIFGWLMPDPPKQLAPGAELTSAETDASIAKIYGKVEKKTGHIVFKETNDNDDDDYPNDLLHIIVVWGEAVESIDEVYIDDIPNSSNDDAFYAGDKRAVFVRNFPNGMGNYSDPILTRAGWRASDKLEGKACSYIRLEYHDDETAITSEPNLTADLTGTTHSNPATALLDYLTNSIYGKGLPSSYINSASFTYAKALCDSDVEEQLGSGVYRDLFSCNVALDTSATVLENVNTLLKPMRGWLPIINGQLTLIIEEDNTPVDQPIFEEDILQMGKISEGNKNNRFNRVSVTYYDPEADGSKQEAVYPEPDSELFEQMLAEDNGFLREESVELKTCRNYYEALEFAKTYLEVSRQQTRTTITLPKWATIYDVGDVVPVTYMSGLPFWDAKLFRIESKEENREEVKLSIREHQPYIYDFFGLGNKPELPDTTYTNKTPDVPTDLNIEHIYDNFVQVKASWVSESQRFDYRVLKGDVIVQTERVASHSVELSGFDMGQYRFQVRALGGLGKRSGWAEIPLVMQVPSPPTSINLNISNFDIEVIPWLENAGSSVSFDYTITDENATEPGELIRGPAASYTFSGLSPITNYKIWVRSHNPLGVSDWVSVEATTHNDAQPITEIIEPILTPITVDIESLKLSVEDIDNRFVGFEAETLPIVALIEQEEVITKANFAANFINNQEGTIQDVVQTFEQGLESVETSITDVQQQVNGLGITDQVAGLASQQIQTYDVQAALLQQAVNDLSAYMDEAETSQSFALAVNQLQIDVSPEGSLAKDIGELQAVTLSNGNAITATNKRLSQVETDAQGNTSAIEQLNLSVSGLSGNLTGALSRLDSVETTANETATAFSGVQAKVQDSQKGNDALFTFAQQIEVTAANAKEGADVANYAVNQLSNTVNNASTGLSATNTIAQRAESKADGAQSSITAIESRLSGAEEDASASLTLATDNKGDIEGIRASILLRTDANGVVSAISLDSQNGASQIAWQAQQVVTLDDEGNPVVFWDTTNGRYVFIGHIDATTGSFGGQLNGATGTFSGSLSAASGTFTGTVQGGALISSSGTGFRSIWEDDGTYLGWIGQGAKNDQNSIFAIKKAKNGSPAKVLVNAQFIEGLSSIRGYNEDDDHNVSVVHKDSVGNDVDLTITADVGNFYTTTSNTSSQSITFAWRIVRNSTVIKTGQMRGRREARYENGQYLVIEVASATIIARDTAVEFIPSLHLGADHGYLLCGRV